MLKWGRWGKWEKKRLYPAEAQRKDKSKNKGKILYRKGAKAQRKDKT